MTALHVGDCVRLVDPRPITLLGYERTFGILEEEAYRDPEVRRIIQRLHLNPRAARRVAQAVAGQRLAALRGAERKLERGEPLEELRGKCMTILSRVVRKTGRHVPPTYSDDMYDDGYEPAYLDAERTWVCYQLGNAPRHAFRKEVPRLHVDGYVLHGVRLRDRKTLRMPWPPPQELWVTSEQVEPWSLRETGDELVEAVEPRPHGLDVRP